MITSELTENRKSNLKNLINDEALEGVNSTSVQLHSFLNDYLVLNDALHNDQYVDLSFATFLINDDMKNMLVLLSNPEISTKLPVHLQKEIGKKISLIMSFFEVLTEPAYKVQASMDFIALDYQSSNNKELDIIEEKYKKSN